MDFKAIINQSELIYASKKLNESSSKWENEDRNFRKWSLKEIQCKVCYYETHPLVDIDLIIAGILQNLPGNSTSAIELATLLGFNVYDNFESNVKHYKDSAEIAIFEELLKEVLGWGLVELDDKKLVGDFVDKNVNIKLTALGIRALADNCKYQFFSGIKNLYENGLNSSANVEGKFFPFYEALGVYSQIENSSKIPYDKIVDLETIFNPQDVETLQKHKLQSVKKFNIYSSIAGTFNFTSVDVDIKLYLKDQQYYPIVFFDEQISDAATVLLNSPENVRIRDIKIEWGLYLRLLNDPNAILDYKALEPFLDIFNLNNLIRDSRFSWGDDTLFNYIASQANANEWITISKICPTDTLKLYLNTYSKNLEWNTLTIRFNNDFILQYPTEFPWNFELLISKENLGAENIKSLLLNKYLRDISEIHDIEESEQIQSAVEGDNRTRYIEWDWDVIMPLLDQDFILLHINEINFDLSEFTQKLEPDKYNYVADYPTKRWNWNYISSDFSLSFLLENIGSISSYLNLKAICNRAFKSPEFVETFCISSDLKRVVENAENTSLIGFSANNADYQWTDLLISTLSQLGLITWESFGYTSGFECNSYLKWDKEFFDKYHKEIKTEQGFRQVSSMINDESILKAYPEYSWDWDTLSSRDVFNTSVSFLEDFKEKINLNIIIESVSWNVIELMFDKLNILTFLNNNAHLWKRLTQIATKDFILSHLEYNWDWLILTHRFCNTINVKSLGNPIWIEKWDWEYLSKNMDISKIEDSIGSYIQYWNWSIITRRISSGFIIRNINKYQSYWDWEFLSSKIDIQQIEDNLSGYIQYWNWNTITSRISSDFIGRNLNTYQHYWDWTTITQRIEPEFAIKNLNKYQEFWDWNILLNDKLEDEHLLVEGVLHSIAQCLLSVAEELSIFYWSSITRKFTIDELEELIAKTYNSEGFFWDYQYLYNSKHFDGKKYLVESFQCISWKDFSASDAANSLFVFDKSIYSKKTWVNKVVAKLLNNPSYKWDYNELTKLPEINNNHEIFTIEMGKWDWDYISEYSSCFKNSTSFETNFSLHKDRINYALFSKRIDSGIEESLIEQHFEKNWNWDILVNNPSITFSFGFILKHIEKPWDWGILSSREDLTWNIIDKYSTQNWDWSTLSQNSKLKLTGDFLINYADKPWDWSIISTRTDIQFDEKVISALVDKPFDWKSLSRNISFVPNDSVLSIIQEKWDSLDWFAISQNAKVDILTVPFLDKYKARLDWSVINKKIGTNITDHHLYKLFDFVDWDSASKSQAIDYTSDFIDRYRKYWNWSELRNNPKIIERGILTEKYRAELNCADFIEHFPNTPFIYHFTHLFNAVEIIKNRKILSRHKAEGKFANAAGNLVARRSTAHDYARFYYRPQTLTQFYNECLGKDSSDEYFQRAFQLGLPKCPIPVFFKFDLKEVLTKMPERCYYSTGNMQTNWASVIKIAENPNSLTTEGLYYKMEEAYNYAVYNCDGYDPPKFRQLMSQYRSDCKQYSQQEFLVVEEFDFSELNSFEIICYDDEQARLLKAQLGDNQICEKISSNNHGIFHRGNPELSIHESETEILVSSDYRDNAFLAIKGDGLKSIKILNPENIQIEKESEIMAYPKVRFTKSDQPIEVHFVDFSVGTRTWLVYKN